MDMNGIAGSHVSAVLSRRNAMKGAVGALLASAAAGNESRAADLSPDYPRGAIYIPARAFNAYQQWRDYDPKIAQRDVQLARRLNLNAFRVWLSYEFWLHDSSALHHHLTDFLQTCSAAGIRVMPVLFEGDGVEPTPANIIDTNPWSASDLLSPSTAIVGRPHLWAKPLDYLDWFMHHFRNDHRLLAIEINNELFGRPRHRFAYAMLQHAARMRGAINLTVGGANLGQSRSFISGGSQILQTHPDFPSSIHELDQVIRQMKKLHMVLNRPVWLTEWQRVRHGGSGWGRGALAQNAWQPDYASLAPTIHRHKIGNLFWSLMLKPAWLLVQRRKGTLNGVFHEDGAVWSAADARAISGDANLKCVERAAWPEWAAAIPRRLGMPVKISG